MNSPKVSIIIPAYNVERYIEECLESVLEQTYKNIEIIVIDDKSTDATAYLLKDYENRVKVVLSPVNQGQGTVRNQGAALAEGDYIFFVDADDWIEPQTVEDLVEEFEKTGVELIRFNAQTFQENLNPDYSGNHYDFSSTLKENKVYEGIELLEANRKSFSASPCLYMTRKEVIEKHGIRFAEGVIHEDEVFTTHLFAEIKSMAYLNKAYYHRRYRVASTMTELSNAHKIKSFDSYLAVYEELEKFYSKPNYTNEQRQFVKRQMLSVYNGLKNLDVPPVKKKALKNLSNLTIKDRLHVYVSNLKQKQSRKK